MQLSTGQYSTQAGDPAQPVQLSRITAIIFGFFFLRSGRPCDIGSNFRNPSKTSIASLIASPNQCGMKFDQLAIYNRNGSLIVTYQR